MKRTSWHTQMQIYAVKVRTALACSSSSSSRQYIRVNQPCVSQTDQHLNNWTGEEEGAGGSSGKREIEGGGGEGPTGGKRENGSCVKIMELAARVERALPEARCSLAYPVCLNIEPNPTLKAKQTACVRRVCRFFTLLPAWRSSSNTTTHDGWVEGRTRHALV